MREEYTEYNGRRSHKHNTHKKNTGYLKKLLRQTLFSIIILSVVISPELLGLEIGKNIKDITKSALLYTIDTEFITEAFKNIYPYKGEIKNAEEPTPKQDI